MKAINYPDNSDDFGTLTMETVDKPVAAPGLAVVAVKAASINPIDGMVMKGYLKGAGWQMPLPFTPGYDFAGVVDSVDPSDSSSNFKVGDEVFGTVWGKGKHDAEGSPMGGCFAEYVLVPISMLSKKPEQVSFGLAAATSLVGTTAYQCLFNCLEISAGSKILILGGAGSVGSIAIQLAKAAGLWVATTASTRNLEFVSQFGADHVINYREEDWSEDPLLEGIDYVFDTVGEKDGFQRATTKDVVKEGGSFVSISSYDVGFDPTAHSPRLKYGSFYVLSNDPTHQDKLASMLADGSLKVEINKTFNFSLDEVQEMFRTIDSGTSSGKNVLFIDGEC